MATQMLDNGAVTAISAILGHEKLETTQIYNEGGHKAVAEGSCSGRTRQRSGRKSTCSSRDNTARPDGAPSSAESLKVRWRAL